MAHWQYQRGAIPLAPMPALDQDAKGPSDSGPLSAIHQLQYTAVVGPVFVPTAVVPDTIEVRGQQGGIRPGRIRQHQYTSLVGPLVVLEQPPAGHDPSQTWRPILPDVPRRVDIHPARLTAVVWKPETPTGFVDGDRRWNAFVPAFVYRPTLHPARISFLSWDPETPVGFVDGHRRWNAFVPASVPRLSVHASRIPSQFWEVTTPAAPTIIVGSVHDGSVIEREIRIQYQAVTGPVFITTPAAPFTGPFVAAFQRQPDQVPVETGLTATYAPYYFAGPIEQMILDWLPIKPDRIWKRGRRAHFAPYFGGLGVPTTVVESFIAQTTAGYPASIAQRRLPTALYPYADASPNPQIEIDRQAQTTSVAAWRGTYPDYLWRRALLTAEMPAFTTGSQASSFPIPDLSWLGDYPDRLTRRWLSAALQQAMTFVATEQGAPAPDYWYPVYPERIARRAFHPAYTRAETYVRFIDPVPELAWAPSYPDRLWRRQMHPWMQPRGADIWPSIFAVTPTALTSYPDWIVRRTLPPAAFPAWTTGALEVSPELAWHPTYPDRLIHQRLATALMSAVTKDLTTVDVPPLAWHTEYPDQIARRLLSPAQMLAFTIGSYGTLTIPELSWLGSYPDAYREPRSLRHRAPWFAFWPEPIPNPDVVDLSWQPHYVDRVHRLWVRVAALPFAWWNTTTPVATPTGWDPQLQFPMRRPVRTIGWSVVAPDLSHWAPEAWKGSYPDRLWAKAPTPTRQVVTDPSPALIRIAETLGWQPTAPAFVFRARRTIDLPPLTMPPSVVTPPDAICVILDAIDGSAPYLAAEVCTPATFDNTFVTTAHHDDEEVC